MANLRGFKAGTAAGDTLVAASAELIVPLTSPLNVGKIGVSVFADRGTVYDKGERFADQTMREGYGGSVWFTRGVPAADLRRRAWTRRVDPRPLRRHSVVLRGRP